MRLEPYRLAREARDLALDLPLDSFPRLEALVESADGRISVRARFDRDDHGRVRIDGRLGARVAVRCGNCREVEPVDLDLPIDLCVVAGEAQARALVGEVDPLILEGTEATVAELFEDDLLLGLPDRPCGGDPDCPHRPPEISEPLPEPQAPKENPFAALAGLRRAEADAGEEDDH